MTGTGIAAIATSFMSNSKIIVVYDGRHISKKRPNFVEQARTWPSSSMNSAM